MKLNYYCYSTNTPKSNLSKLIRIQDKVMRLLANADWKTHAPPLYSKLNILSLNKLTTHAIAKFIHKHDLGKLPKNFDNYFTLVSSVHSRTTRNFSKLHQHFIPQFPTNKLQRSIKYNERLKNLEQRPRRTQKT